MVRIYTNYNKRSRLLEADIPSADTNNDPATEDSELDSTLEFEDESDQKLEPDEVETDEEKKLTTKQLIVDTNNKLIKLINILNNFFEQNVLEDLVKLLDWDIYPATKEHLTLHAQLLQQATQTNGALTDQRLKLLFDYIQNANTLMSEVSVDKCWTPILQTQEVKDLIDIEKEFLKYKNITVARVTDWVVKEFTKLLMQHEETFVKIVTEKDNIVDTHKVIATRCYKVWTQIKDWFVDLNKDFKNSFKQLHWPRKTVVKLKHRIEAILKIFDTKQYITEDNQTEDIPFLNMNFLDQIRELPLEDWKPFFDKTDASTKVILKELSSLSKRLIKKQEKEKTDNWQYIFDRAVKSETSGKTGAVQRAWTKYYTKEFPYMNRKVLGTIGTAFTQEINDLGFTVLKNPFIAYLKYMGGKPEFKRNIVQNPSPYIQIHNAVAKRVLTFNDLFGLGYFKRNNIIFTPDFYKQSIHDTSRYLDAQHQLEKIFNKGDNVPFSHSYLSERYKGPEGRIQFFIDLFYEPGNIDSGPLTKQRTGDEVRGVTPGLSKQQKKDLKQGKEIYAPKPVDEILKGKPGGKLQPIDRIENNLTKCFSQEVLELDPDEAKWQAKLKPITTDDLVNATNDIRKKLRIANPRDLDDLLIRLDPSNFDPETWQTKPPVMVNELIHDAGWRFPTLAECENDQEVLENIRAHLAAEVKLIRDRTDRKRAGV